MFDFATALKCSQLSVSCYREERVRGAVAQKIE